MATPTSSKKMKKADLESDSSEVEAMEETTEKDKVCIICGKVASREVVKNTDFVTMMQMYWATVAAIDVKPDTCVKSDVCPKCFDKLANYYETNDIILYFENYFKSLRFELLRETMKGTAKREKDGCALTREQKELVKKYGNDPDIEHPEEEQVKQTLATFKMEVSLKDDAGSPRTIKLSKKGVENGDANKVNGKKNHKKGAKSADPKRSLESEESD